VELPLSNFYRYREGGLERQPQSDRVRLLELTRAVYTECPFYGSRKMARELTARAGYRVSRRRARKLMRDLGLKCQAPAPDTSAPSPENKAYPYLLKDMKAERPNQVWSTDITYIRTARGFCYLVAVIDWYSRKTLSWRLSNSMGVEFCCDCLEDALSRYGRPEIFNSDQGSQFTSKAFTSMVAASGARISMDGKGRCRDNIYIERFWRSLKQEEVYSRQYETMAEARAGIESYMAFYNTRRLHQSLGYGTPDQAYFAQGPMLPRRGVYDAEGGEAALPLAA
jgi:putative transposase